MKSCQFIKDSIFKDSDKFGIAFSRYSMNPKHFIKFNSQ